MQGHKLEKENKMFFFFVIGRRFHRKLVTISCFSNHTCFRTACFGHLAQSEIAELQNRSQPHFEKGPLIKKSVPNDATKHS